MKSGAGKGLRLIFRVFSLIMHMKPLRGLNKLDVRGKRRCLWGKREAPKHIGVMILSQTNYI